MKKLLLALAIFFTGAILYAGGPDLEACGSGPQLYSTKRLVINGWYVHGDFDDDLSSAQVWSFYNVTYTAGNYETYWKRSITIAANESPQGQRYTAEREGSGWSHSRGLVIAVDGGITTGCASISRN